MHYFLGSTKEGVYDVIIIFRIEECHTALHKSFLIDISKDSSYLAQHICLKMKHVQ